MKLSREERRSHLDLTTSCVEIGGSSSSFRALLAHHLKTTIPRGSKVHLCHAYHNGKCSNIKHLYWGTNKDNGLDMYENVGTSVYSRTRRKYGDSVHDEMLKAAAVSGGKGNKGKTLSKEHKKKISEALINRKSKASYSKTFSSSMVEHQSSKLKVRFESV